MSREGVSAIGAGADRGLKVRRAVALALASAAAMWTGTAQAQESNSAPAVLELEDVVVVGTRLRGGGITETHLPVTVFDAEDIARTGVSNIADVLEYLPSKTLGPTEQASPSAALVVQLRGLTIGNTLVLINGRRTVGSATLSGGAGSGFNLNTIPITAVERIEVLSDSASAVYGADAVGGVVNIVLKKSIPAPFVSAYYGKAQGGADERRASAGFGVDGERLRLSLLGDYFERDFLFGRERDQTSNSDFTRFGGTDLRVATGRLANIARQGGGNLPGLTSPRATVPAGSTGIGLTPADFVPTAGQINRTSLLQNASIVPESRRYAATGLADFSITDRLRVFGEVFFSNQEDERRTSPGMVNGTVAANQAFNPFDVPLTVNYVLPDSQVQYSESELIRGVLGMRGGLGTWDWEVYGLNSSENGTTALINQPNAAAVAAALRSADPATALNVFTDRPLDPSIAALVLNPRNDDRYSSDITQGSAFVRGSLFDMPAGELSVVLGGEWRREGVHTETRTSNTFVTADRNVKSGFAEARVPLVDKDMSIPLLRSLAVTTAVRYDDYSDFGNTTNPQFGLEWNMFSGFLVRASYGDAFRAPTLFDLNQAQATNNLNIQDPRRGNAVTSVPVTTGGNPNLQPEESNTLSAGIVFTPEALPGFRVALTYWKIEQEQRLQRITQNTLLANEAFFPDRVQRAAPTPADIAAGRPGALTALNLTALNSGALDTDGIDLEFATFWQGSWGTFSPSLMVTRVTDYTAADFPGQPAVDRLGSANSQGAIPETRGTLSLGWRLKGYGLTPTVRYSSAYNDVSIINVPLTTEVDSQVLVDLQASLAFEEAFNAGAWTRGLNLRIGVLNLTDEEAPFANVGGVNGYDSSQSDLRGRFSYLTLEKSF